MVSDVIGLRFIFGPFLLWPHREALWQQLPKCKILAWYHRNPRHWSLHWLSHRWLTVYTAVTTTSTKIECENHYSPTYNKQKICCLMLVAWPRIERPNIVRWICHWPTFQMCPLTEHRIMKMKSTFDLKQLTHLLVVPMTMAWQSHVLVMLNAIKWNQNSRHFHCVTVHGRFVSHRIFHRLYLSECNIVMRRCSQVRLMRKIKFIIELNQFQCKDRLLKRRKQLDDVWLWIVFRPINRIIFYIVIQNIFQLPFLWQKKRKKKRLNFPRFSLHLSTDINKKYCSFSRCVKKRARWRANSIRSSISQAQPSRR